VIVSIKVKPGKPKDGVELQEKELVVHLRARAKNNEANKALIELLARTFDISRSSIAIKRGLKSPLKTVDMKGLNYKLFLKVLKN